MSNRLQELMSRIIQLENNLLVERQKKEKAVHRYLHEAPLLNIRTSPITRSCLIPAQFMDLMITRYPYLCYSIYAILKVWRGDTISSDHQYLYYLNPVDKLNCCYSGYFAGILADVKEKAARKEQYWSSSMPTEPKCPTININISWTTVMGRISIRKQRASPRIQRH